MKRRLKIAALIVGLFAVLVVALLAWVIYTEAGLKFAVARLPERMGRVTLRIEDVNGTIAGGFRAARVSVDHERSRVYIQNASARVNFWPLLVGRISVRSATADLVHIEAKRRARPPPDTPPKFLPRLLSISAERAAARSLVIIAPNGKRIVFEDVSGAGIVKHRTIRIFEGDIIYGVLHSRALGELRAGNPMKLRGEATTRMIIEGQPEWLAETSFEGDLTSLPVTGRLQAPFRADVRGELRDLNSNFNWSGEAEVHNFDLGAFGAGDALGIVSGTLAVGGEMDAFHARGPLLVPGLGAGLFDVGFEGHYTDDRVNATHYEVTHRATGSHADGAGTIEVVAGGPRLALAGSWRDVRWPLAARFTAENPQIFSTPSGKYTLAGVWPYVLTASGDLYVPGIEPMTFAMGGDLHRDHLAIRELDLGAFGGRALLAGEARWSPAESWTLAGEVTGFNPAELRPGFQGALSFRMKASGAPFGGDNLDFDFRDLTGRLRGTTTSGSGHIVLQGEDWTFEDLRLRAGATNLFIDGHLGPSRALDFDFSIDADDLGLLSPDARGSLHASGTVVGTAGSPVIKLIARGSGIERQGVTLDELHASVDVDWRGQRASHADITLAGLAVDERELTQFRAVLDGNTNAHTFRVDALAAQTSLRLSGQGSFADPTWNATVTELLIDDSANVNLELEAPVPVMVSGRAFSLGALCLHGKVARLCGEGAWNEGTWNARAEAINLPISSLTAGLTPRVEYQGTLNAKAALGGSRGLPFTGTARADLVDAAIRHRLASGRTDIIKFGSGYISLNAQPDHLAGELRLDAAARGLIAGRLRAERNAADIADWPVRGQLQMATGELGFITLYAPEIDRASGQFDTNLSFDGTLGRPMATGVVKLSGAELDLYQLNLALRAVELEARIVANNLEFSSAASAGRGTLASSGRIEWREGLPYGNIRLDGENLRLVDVPEARIDASPDLDFRISGRDILVRGEVKLPYARIQPADLTNAVLPSADEVLVGPTEETAKDPFRVTSEITLTLGDNVTVDTYGLSGHVEGSITERTQPGEPTRATGELQVREGEYVALARRLDIERGRLIFSGGLLVDPGVDIRAVKEFPDVKAGVNVRGTLREPRLSFFSEPAIPQSQIVSLLLAGGSLQSVQDQSRAGTPQAKQEVAGQAAALLVSQFGDKLGLPEISVESDYERSSDQGIGTSLVLGKYLSPRLYVSWGVSLSEAINTFKMRYTIDDRWTIKTEAGKDSSADLVYTIEK